MGIQDHSEELLSLGISTPKDKNLCIKHIEEKVIKHFIRKNYKDGYCDYCCKELKVVSLEDLLKFMMKGISNFYQDAAEFMYYDGRNGGYQGETYTPDELIQEAVGLDANPFKVIEDIVDSIDNIPWASEFDYYDPNGDLLLDWNSFKKRIKHTSRYFFLKHKTNNLYSNSKIIDVLNKIGKVITKLGMVRPINHDEILYRCRQHKRSDKLRSINQLVSPPKEFAIYPNRFSPSGISMLYCSFDSETAKIETIDKSNDKNKYYTTAKFKTKNSINVIDFTSLPKFPSIFEYKKVERHFLLLFIQSLIEDISAPIIKDGKEHIEYIPTQVVTEYFRFPYNQRRKNKINGIIYPSSKNNKPCIVIFWDNEESVSNLSLLDTKTEKVQ